MPPGLLPPRPDVRRTSDSRWPDAGAARLIPHSTARRSGTAASDLVAHRSSKTHSLLFSTQALPQMDEPLSNIRLYRAQWPLQFFRDFTVAQPLIKRTFHRRSLNRIELIQGRADYLT